MRSTCAIFSASTLSVFFAVLDMSTILYVSASFMSMPASSNAAYETCHMLAVVSHAATGRRRP